MRDMKIPGRNRIIGYLIASVSFAVSFVDDSIWLGVPCGALMAVGVCLIFKWIPFKKENRNVG